MASVNKYIVLSSIFISTALLWSAVSFFLREEDDTENLASTLLSVQPSPQPWIETRESNVVNKVVKESSSAVSNFEVLINDQLLLRNKRVLEDRSTLLNTHYEFPVLSVDELLNIRVDPDSRVKLVGTYAAILENKFSVDRLLAVSKSVGFNDVKLSRILFLDNEIHYLNQRISQQGEVINANSDRGNEIESLPASRADITQEEVLDESVSAGGQNLLTSEEMVSNYHRELSYLEGQTRIELSKHIVHRFLAI